MPGHQSDFFSFSCREKLNCFAFVWKITKILSRSPESLSGFMFHCDETDAFLLFCHLLLCKVSVVIVVNIFSFSVLHGSRSAAHPVLSPVPDIAVPIMRIIQTTPRRWSTHVHSHKYISWISCVSRDLRLIFPDSVSHHPHLPEMPVSPVNAKQVL